jgi:hypothetical protein
VHQDLEADHDGAEPDVEQTDREDREAAVAERAADGDAPARR